MKTTLVTLDTPDGAMDAYPAYPEAQGKGPALVIGGAGRIKVPVFYLFGAEHGFFRDPRSSYKADAAVDAWRRTLDWLKRRLA